MLTLTGKNLGERHRELNLKVIEATNKKTDLNEIISRNKPSDIETLFQIDLASRYRNLDYILDTLKSGDSLYITRALKCTWIFDDEYLNIINPTYLHNNLFPYMSLKMKRKMLTKISMHVRNEDRVLSFYSYCINCKLKVLAMKFVIYSAEAFKLDLIKNDDDDFDPFDNTKYLKPFIGNSFTLAAMYVDMHLEKYRPGVVHDLRFLYFDFEEEYLNMLEKYVQVAANHPNSVQRFGIRISRAILRKHINRFWKHPVLYINKLNKNMVVKCLSSKNIKHFTPLLMPTTSSYFWSMDFYHSYKFILDLIPPTEIFAHLKDIFSCKYNEKCFETNLQFYNLKYYEMFTAEEQEAWALRHIEREEELFGSGNDYIWYKFVRFEKAFVGIKKYIFITPDNDLRSKIVNILIDSAKSHDDLTKLLNYYYERHVNESDEHKMSFIDQIISEHDVYDFTNECWEPFDKLLYSLEVYNAHNTKEKLKYYVIRSMIYHILNNVQFSEELQRFIECERVFYIYDEIISALSEERRYLVVKYWLDFHADQLRVLLDKPRDDKVQEDIDDRVCLVWNIIFCYNRNAEECPEIVLTYMKSNLKLYQSHPVFQEKFKVFTEEDFVRLLKQDTVVTIDSISQIMCNAYRWSFKLNRLLRKLKIYFSDDVSEEYLQYFNNSLDLLNEYGRQYRNIKMAVVGVFQLGSEESKIALLEKYAPTNRKINHGKIDNFLLQVQKAICRLSYQSRPPVQLDTILKYITGDYVRFCLPMFRHYSANLPINRAIEFIYKLIDSPVSIQKHGLRLASQCFQSHDFVQVIVKIWKNTKNVSLRLLLFKTLYMKMVNSDDDSQNVLYDALKMCTLDLNHQDHEDVFDLLVSDDMPGKFRGMYIETAWRTVSKFSNKKVNLRRKTSIIDYMRENIVFMNREFLREHIIDEHVRTMLHENRFKTHYGTDEIDNLIKTKWHLTALYIICVKNNSNIEQSKILTKEILAKCTQTWNHQYMGVYTTRKFCNDFLNAIHYESCISVPRYMNNLSIYQCILDVLQKSLKKEELYLSSWKLNLSIQSRRVLFDHYRSHNECLQFKNPCAVEIAEAFSKEIGKLVQGTLNTKKFYYSFYSEMANALKNVCETMGRHLTSNGFKILVCGYLMQTKVKETHVLAVMLMPKDPPKQWEKRHHNVVNIIKQSNSEEIQLYFHNKFESGYSVRKIL